MLKTCVTCNRSQSLGIYICTLHTAPTSQTELVVIYSLDSGMLFTTRIFVYFLDCSGILLSGRKDKRKLGSENDKSHSHGLMIYKLTFCKKAGIKTILKWKIAGSILSSNLCVDIRLEF